MKKKTVASAGRMGRDTLVLLLVTMTVWVTFGSASAAKPTATTSGASTPTASPSPTAAAASSVPSAAASTSSAAGSGMAFESTMLMYQSAIAAAQHIADALHSGSAKKQVLVLTQADINAFAALQIVLRQGNVLDTQINAATKRIRTICEVPPASKPSPKATTKNANIEANFNLAGIAAALGITGAVPLGATTAAAVTAWVTTAAQISAVTETLSSSQGALTDQAFMILVSGEIRKREKADGTRSPVIIPSLYPPSALAKSGKSDLGNLVATLETDRAALLAKALGDTQLPKCLATADPGKRINQQVAATSLAVDAFETSLFTGSSTAIGPFATSTPFQQMLAADQLSQVLGDPQTYQIAVIRAGDSGGSSLTKQSLFLGTRQYYSGGAGAYYLLFDGKDGGLTCGGYGYGYHGFIAAGDVGLGGLTLMQPGADSVGAKYHPGDKLPDLMRERSEDCK